MHITSHQKRGLGKLFSVLDRLILDETQDWDPDEAAGGGDEQLSKSYHRPVEPETLCTVRADNLSPTG